MSDWRNDLMLSSERDDWRTPKDLFDELNAEFNFTVDLCADDNNHLCEKYYTEQNSGFDADLTGERVYCNPPYGRKSTADWIRKCAECSADVVVMLLPARTDTKAFHEYIYHKAEIRFIQGRLYFGGGRKIDRAPFPSMIVIFKR
jgi:site-specific DNA-methyltransferase (adenine-specific)